MIYPLPQQEFSALKRSIKEHGLWNPIIINKEGYVLDGRHRLKICQELDIQPSTKTVNLNDKLEEQLLVYDSNRKRRHLNVFQRVSSH